MPGSRRIPIPRKRLSAFTLLELVMVICILTILASIVAPKYASAVGRYRLDSAARRVAADIEQTRALARATGANRSISFVPANNSYSIAGIVTGTSRGAVYSVRLDAPPYSVTLESASFAGGPELLFGGFGMPADGGTIVVRSGSETKTISVDSITGSVTIQ